MTSLVSFPPSPASRLLLLAAALTFSLTGCGSGVDLAAARSLAALPSSSMVSVGNDVSFHASGALPGEGCTWSSSDEDVLGQTGDGTFHASGAGTANVNVTCGTESAVATVAVANAAAVAPTSIIIKSGGTYSGVWNSNDPKTPAVSIRTNAPVIIQNSTITSVGDLINIKGDSPTSGANVTVQNVTGTALDPQVNGKERGAFVTAQNVSSLVVKNNTIQGASFGVAVYYSTLNLLQIQNNSAKNLEDRASNGQGGFTTRIPAYGHMVILDDVIAPNGADISWNQLVNTIGASSTQDVINIYKSQGTPTLPIRAHDNYMEGFSSPAMAQYTGSGLITDGDAAAPVTAYVQFDSNEVVHTAGSGVVLANGHDQKILNNRIVSCGQDASGTWFAAPFVNAVIVTNYYQAPTFTNHTVSGNVGGMVRPSATNVPIAVDFWSDSMGPTDQVSTTGFTDPCFVGGKISLTAETNERAFWAAKLKNNHILIGDQH